LGTFRGIIVSYNGAKEMMTMSMGDIIKSLRISHKMTQEELGAHIGVQKSAIRKYECGRVENIPRASIEKMAMLFGVKPSYLMRFDDAPQPKENPPVLSEDERRFQELMAEIEKIFKQMSREDQQLYLALLRRGLGKS
jgi:transcriptional regulator with XRE-family HTH domain